MKKILFPAAALLIAAGCSNPKQADTTQADAIAANTRPDGSVIDESKPHEHADANGGSGSMEMAMMTPKAGDSEATRGFKSAMMNMMQGMPPFTGDADVDFNKQMRIHHMAAIEMAATELATGKDAESKALAQEIVTAQKKEIARIDAWLARR